MATGSSGGTLLAALALGAAIVVASLIVKSGLDDQTVALADLEATVAELGEALAAGAPSAARREPRRGRDPNQRVEIPLGDSPVRGPEKAQVTIVEYSDFRCGYCARAVPTLIQLIERYDGRVNLVYKHFPVLGGSSPDAAAAAEAARLQGKFWEMHDRIFRHQRELSDARYAQWAGELGLDVERFERDRKSEAVRARVERDQQEAMRLGVSGTPSFFINGRLLVGALPIEEFQRIIDEELKG